MHVVSRRDVALLPRRFRNGIRARRPGLPGACLALAALMPALVRSEISARSSCATAPRTCSENIPCGVEVSIGSFNERKCAPCSSSCSMTKSKWLTERAKRSRRTTTRTSPGDNLAHQPCQNRSRPRRTRSVFLVNCMTARSFQFDDLSVMELIFGGNAGVTQ